MSKEKQIKQIENLAEDILQEYTNCYSEVDKEVLTKMIYNAVYRKQSVGDANIATTTGEWISVEERLPTYKDGKVLIYTAYGISIAERTVNERWKGDCAIPKLITHWMPLPEAPKMKGENNG